MRISSPNQAYILRINLQTDVANIVLPRPLAPPPRKDEITLLYPLCSLAWLDSVKPSKLLLLLSRAAVAVSLPLIYRYSTELLRTMSSPFVITHAGAMSRQHCRFHRHHSSTTQRHGSCSCLEFWDGPHGPFLPTARRAMLYFCILPWACWPPSLLMSPPSLLPEPPDSAPGNILEQICRIFLAWCGAEKVYASVCFQAFFQPGPDRKKFMHIT